MLLEKANVKETATNGEIPTKILLIGQSNTLGFAPIPATIREIHNVENLMGAAGIGSLLLEGAAATISQVWEGMRTHSWVHFACHANTHCDTLKSGLHLHDGLLEVTRQRIQNADLAFLSACSTSTGSDAAVNLAGGMLAAGYRGVVATMWPIQDDDGPVIANHFYMHMLEEKLGDRQLNSANAALALDYATQRMREELEKRKATEMALLRWVSFVHFGV